MPRQSRHRSGRLHSCTGRCRSRSLRPRALLKLGTTGPGAGRRSAPAAALAAAAIAVAAAGGLIWLGPTPAGEGAEPTAEKRSPPSSAQAAAAYSRLPLRLEENRGQADPRVRFLARGPGHALLLTKTRAIMSLTTGSRRAAVWMTFVGADRGVTTRAGRRLPGASNYFLGGDRRRWRRGVPAYANVTYRGMYPGIDVVYHARGRDLEYDFVVAPGADPDLIQLAYSGARARLDRSGDLVLRTVAGTLRHRRPVAYQRIDGRRQRVPARFDLTPRGRVRIALGRYDRRRPLVIDPVIAYSTYIGGAIRESEPRMTAGRGGHVHLVGATASVEFPTRDALHSDKKEGGDCPIGPCADAFVAELDTARAGRDGLVYSTYLGGTDEETPTGIAIDSSENAYLTGRTCSADFPAEGQPVAAKQDGDCDGFVTKLSGGGSKLAYSSFLGGRTSRAVAVDDSGGVWLAGSEWRGAGRGGDAFVARLSPGEPDPFTPTYIGGSGQDGAEGLAVGCAPPTCRLYMTGTTRSEDFPTESAYQGAPGGGRCGNPLGDSGPCKDIFVAVLDAHDRSLAYSTYLGGSGDDSGRSIAVDAGGSAYVTGDSVSSDFPIRSAAQRTHGGGACGSNSTVVGACLDAIAAKLEPAAAGDDSLAYSTYLGGDRDESGAAIVVDAAESAYLTGWTFSENFPTSDALEEKMEGDGDAFIAKLSASGQSFEHSTYLGAEGTERGTAIALDGTGNVYVAGETSSDYFPTLNPFQDRREGQTDVFVTKLAPKVAGSPRVDALEPRSGPVAGGAEVVIRGSGFTDGAAVKFGSVPAGSVVVESPGRIRAVAPPHPEGGAYVSVSNGAAASGARPRARFFYGHGAWRKTEPAEGVRHGATATLLRNGKVLVAGGCLSPDLTVEATVEPSCALRSAELYDPKAESWAPAPPMAAPRVGHTATLLGNGKVLVTGNGSAEVYDPSIGPLGAWLPTGAPTNQRLEAAAVLLPNGKVLVAGGGAGFNRDDETGYETADRSAELYDPLIGAFTPTGKMTYGRAHSFAAVLLPTGKILVAGGYRGVAFDDTVPVAPPEIYDPGSGSWVKTAAWGLGRYFGHSATVLPVPPASACRAACGRVLVAGGRVADARTFTASTELYDPSTGAWSPTGSLSIDRSGHAAALLPGGLVLAAGGTGGGPLAAAELYDPRAGAAGRWRPAGWMSAARGASAKVTHAATLISSDPGAFAADPGICGSNCGKVLVTGGSGDGSAELYTPPPTISAIGPGTGSAAGGTQVTIEGTGFTHGTREARFGATTLKCPSASCQVESYSRLRLLSPPSATNARVPITVVNEGGAAESSDMFTYTDAPEPPRGGGDGGGTAPAGGGAQRGAGGNELAIGLIPGAERLRALALRRCLRGAAHEGRDARRHGHRVGRRRARPRLRARERCLRRHGRTPGRVGGLRARTLSSTRIALDFRAAGSDGKRPPAARSYLVKQSLRPIRSGRAFRRARKLCDGACRFRATRVGARLRLTITGLRPKTSYYYAIAARDNVSGRPGPRSRTVHARTR